ncbi:CoA-transferase [Desulfosporosinus sp. PR]|uniref:CoA-transferase subunit beta n=1 Tax=Candidatus Desulfosporosinus nitrosoreducens TaxID=3401928 RepID=UPI0027F35662|nr:CoA-transferase [Desulfosporosinus sp. PR]MDQ7096824.1 CoA-transferase [Desulfosporosinus sp. PR]
MSIDQSYLEYLDRTGLKAEECTQMELLAVATKREIPNGAFIFVGTGLPLLAGMLAQHTAAPDMTMILEAGTVGPTIKHLPVSVADTRAAYQASVLSTVADAFGTIACRGFCTLGLLGAAECDMYGNLNSSAVGGYWPAGVSGQGRGPATRLTGSGGANSIASLADKIIVSMVHEKRRMVERVEYLTSPCGMRGPQGETRFDYGLFRGGDLVVISDLGILRPNPETGILELDMYYPGVSPEFIRENTGWSLKIEQAREMEPPTFEELRILRTLVDPDRLFLGRKSKRKT